MTSCLGCRSASPSAGMVLRFLQPLKMWIFSTERWQRDWHPQETSVIPSSITMARASCFHVPRSQESPCITTIFGDVYFIVRQKRLFQSSLRRKFYSNNYLCPISDLTNSHRSTFSGEDLWVRFSQFLGSILWCFFSLRHHVVKTSLPASSKQDPSRFKYSWKCSVSLTKSLQASHFLLAVVGSHGHPWTNHWG